MSVMSKIDTFMDYISDKQERIELWSSRYPIRHWSWDALCKTVLAGLFLIMLSPINMEHGAWSKVAAVFIQFSYFGYIISFKVIKEYFAYLKRMSGTEADSHSSIKVISWGSMCKLIKNENMVAIRSTDRKFIYPAAFVSGVDRKFKFVMTEEMICYGSTKLNDRRRTDAFGISSGGVLDTDLVSSSINVSVEEMYVLGFFGWLVYRYQFDNNRKKSLMNNNLSLRLMGADIYNKLLITEKEKDDSTIQVNPFSGVLNSVANTLNSLTRGTSYGQTGTYGGSGVMGSQGVTPIPTITMKGFRRPLEKIPVMIIGCPMNNIKPGQIIYSDYSTKSTKLKKVGYIGDTIDECFIIDKLCDLSRNTGQEFTLKSEVGENIMIFNGDRVSVI